MTEMKARLVDKDGNPLGTAANPLKISGDVGGGVPDGGTTGQVLQKKTDADQDTEWGDGSGAATSWGSIVGTLSDQTDLNAALNSKASKTESDLTLYVYEDATGDADGSSKANAYTTLQAAIDAIPDVAQNVTVIVCKGSTNYLGQTTTIQKASVKSLTIQGEFYAYESCDANAVAGKVVDASADFSDFAVGDRVVCMHYSGTVGSSSIDDYFYATITEVGSGYVQTSEGTKVPTTGWKYLINQTVFDGNNGTNVLIIPYSTIEVLGITFENNTTYAIRGFAKSIRSVIQNVIVKNTGGISADMILSGAAFINSLAQFGIGSGYGRDATIENVIIHGLSNVTIYGGMCYQSGSHTYAYCGFFNLNIAIYSPQSISPVSLGYCYIASSCTYGAYGYNITLSNCTNNATTPVYNLTSGGSIEEWDGQALPSIDDATGGQVLALKSDKSSFEFASKQPLDATLTALAGLTTAANKLPYATGEDTFDVCDFTPLGRSLIGTTTASAVRDLIASASSTTVTQSIYVDSAATGAGTGVDWTNAFTTITAAVDSLPAIINHAVTIYVRKGATPYREMVTVQRVIAGGSLTLQGEYYWNNEAASNSTANRLVKNASDDFNALEVGDKVFLLQYSGSYQASTPNNTYIGTVTDVANKASGYVTISMETSVTPTTGWKYVITKTEISGSDNGTTPARNNCILTSNTSCSIFGFHFTLPGSVAIRCNGGTNNVRYNTVISGAKGGIEANNSVISIAYCGIWSSTDGSASAIKFSGCNVSSILHNGIIGKSVALLQAVVQASGGNITILYNYLRSTSGSTAGAGITALYNASVYINNTQIDGNGSGDKLGVGVYGVYGGVANNYATVSATTVTTAKTPASWATTTDGSYV